MRDSAAGVLPPAILAPLATPGARRPGGGGPPAPPPVGPVLDGAFLLLAGLLLISPGFITDVFALALLIPPVRNTVARWCVRRFAERTHAQAKMYEAKRRAEGGPSGAAPHAEGHVDGPIIEGEFERLGEKGRAPHPGKDRDRI